jgi:vancomycin resistance protein VanK
MPRGPLIAADFAKEETLPHVLAAIAQWAREQLQDLVFVRMEPPLPALAGKIGAGGLKIPPYYVQPRFNLVVPLDVSEEKIVGSFHSSTRSNIRRAENRGVTAVFKNRIEKSELEEFFAMVENTIRRNGGKNAYPGSGYFKSFFQTVPMAGEKHDPKKLSVGMFSGYQNGAPAAIHFVVFFGDTATYLYGASYTDRLSSKVSTYLHWAAMREAKARGLKYYDLGGIDDARWPTLTNFKRQFKGQEFAYIGNLDVPIRPLLYRSYNLFRSFKHP